MSLADQIVANSKSDRYRQKPQPKPPAFDYEIPKVDEFGAPTANCAEYVVARILYIQHQLRENDLYMIPGDDINIYEHGQPIKQDEDTLYRISQWSQPIKKPARVRIYEILKRYLPIQNDDIVLITPTMGWDKKKGDFVYFDEPPTIVN